MKEDISNKATLYKVLKNQEDVHNKLILFEPDHLDTAILILEVEIFEYYKKSDSIQKNINSLSQILLFILGILTALTLNYIENKILLVIYVSFMFYYIVIYLLALLDFKKAKKSLLEEQAMCKKWRKQILTVLPEELRTKSDYESEFNQKLPNYYN